MDNLRVRTSTSELIRHLTGPDPQWALAPEKIFINYHILGHEVAGLIPGTSTNFKCGLGLERVPPSLVRKIGSYLIVR